MKLLKTCSNCKLPTYLEKVDISEAVLTETGIQFQCSNGCHSTLVINRKNWKEIVQESLSFS